MKKLLFLLCVILTWADTGYAQLCSKVDERFELTSTVFALAGVPEYCQCAIPSYRQDMIAEFKTYDRTDPINYIRELNQIHGIGYNAVSTTAEMLEIKNGRIQLRSQYNITKISEIDSRWNEELFSKYIKMLNVFYKQSDFHKFFKKHRPLYQIAEQRMDQLLEETITKWFEDFFEKQLNGEYDINIYISLWNGPNNYAMQHGVLIGLGADERGAPNPTQDATVYMLLHELCHHYANPIFFEYWPQMEAAANKMYPYVKEMMARAAYGSAQTMFCEWMVDLFTLMYMKESTQPYADVFLRFATKENVEKGFIWMQRSVEFMDNFYKNRDLYPHIGDFMPNLIAFVNSTANQYEAVVDEFEHRRPSIIDVYPAIGSDITGFKEIVITFSEPMNGTCAFYGTGSDDPKVKYLYIIDDLKEAVVWSEDRRQAKLILDPKQAEKNCTYGIQLYPRGFQSARYFWLDDSCKNLIFNTQQ